MTRIRALLLAGLLAASFAVPARATSVGIAGGFDCGVEGISTDGSHWTAVLNGGPFSVPSDSTVSIRCRLQAVRFPGDHEPVVEVQSPPQAGVGILPPQAVSFVTDNVPGLSFELCTDVVIYTPPHPPHVVPEDADGDPTNGYQCPPVPQYGDEIGGGHVIVKTSTLFYVPCAVVDIDNPPQPVPPEAGFCPDPSIVGNVAVKPPVPGGVARP